MDLSSYFFSLLFVVCMLKAGNALQMQLEKNIDGIIDSHTTDIECSFQVGSSEEIISIRLFVQNMSSMDFVRIVHFETDKPSVLSENGYYLSDRVILSNLTTLSTNVSLTFEHLECNDERTYMCQINYFNADRDIRKEERSTKLMVRVNPSVPDMFMDKSSVSEGGNFTFICNGSVGKPPRTFIWSKLKGDTVIDSYGNVSTEFSMKPDACSYLGTSNFTTEVTAEDNNAVIRCSVNQNVDYYNESQPLHVQYKVRKPSITKEPSKHEYLVGSNPIRLTCVGRGNPYPSYTWFKDGNVTDSLSLNNTVDITEVITNNSGVYRCNVTNEISGIEHTESTTVTIMIVIDKSTTPMPATATTDKDGTKDAYKEIIGVVTAVVVVICLVIIGFLYCRKRKSNSNVEELFIPHTTRNADGYDLVNVDKGNGVQDKDAESQGHNNLVYNANDIEKTEEENVIKENDTTSPDTRNEYASVNEATKLKNRTIDKVPVENQQKSNQDDTEDPYMASNDNTYARLGEKHKHKGDENTELYDIAGKLTDRL